MCLALLQPPGASPSKQPLPLKRWMHMPATWRSAPAKRYRLISKPDMHSRCKTCARTTNLSQVSRCACACSVPRPCRTLLLRLWASVLQHLPACMSLVLLLPGCTHTWAVHGWQRNGGAAAPFRLQRIHRCQETPAAHRCSFQTHKQLQNAEICGLQKQHRGLVSASVRPWNPQWKADDSRALYTLSFNHATETMLSNSSRASYERPEAVGL